MLPPPAVLGGRYPPLPVSRLLAGDEAFIGGLLAALPGVDPAHSRIQVGGCVVIEERCLFVWW